MSTLGYDPFAPAEEASTERWQQALTAEQTGAATELVGQLGMQLDALRTAIEEYRQSMEDLKQQFADAQQAYEEQATSLNTLLNDLRQVVYGDQANAALSAGGPIDDVEGAIYAAFLPHTGDVVLTHQASVPFGWLECAGTEKAKGDYEQLYKVIANKYGNASSSDRFKLPAANQLTSDATTLALISAGKARFIIRV